MVNTQTILKRIVLNNLQQLAQKSQTRYLPDFARFPMLDQSFWGTILGHGNRCKLNLTIINYC